MYLSTVLHDHSRYIIARKLCSTMRAEDIIDTLALPLAVSGCDLAKVMPQAAPAQRQRAKLHRRGADRTY